MRYSSLVAWLAVSAAAASAHDVITTKITFSKEISRLFLHRCATCHKEGGTAFSLATWEQARPWAKAIKEEVLERRMPPWQAVKGFGDFKDDRGLTQEELELISDWVEGGAPEGEPKFLPSTTGMQAVKVADKWMDPAIPAGTAEVIASAGMKLAKAASVVGVRAKAVKPGASVQIVAVRPDGTVEPLLWLYQYKPAFNRTYYYQSPVALPAGTAIEMSPPGAGSIALFTQPASSSRAAASPTKGR
jgi:hypothetical protein